MAIQKNGMFFLNMFMYKVRYKHVISFVLLPKGRSNFKCCMKYSNHKWPVKMGVKACLSRKLTFQLSPNYNAVITGNVGHSFTLPDQAT